MHILVDCWIESENRATDLFRQFSPFGGENMRGENMGGENMEGDDTSSVTNTMASVWMLSTKQNKSADKRSAQLNLSPTPVMWTGAVILSAIFWYFAKYQQTLCK